MWKNQRKWNDDMQIRVRFIEARVVAASGIAAFLGSGLVYWLLK